MFRARDVRSGVGPRRLTLVMFVRSSTRWQTFRLKLLRMIWRTMVLVPLALVWLLKNMVDRRARGVRMESLRLFRRLWRKNKIRGCRVPA